MKIHVGNVSPEVTEAELHALFASYGKVELAQVVKEKRTARPTGFGFVLMPSRPEAAAALTALQGKSLKGQKLTVKEAPPRTTHKPRPRRHRKDGRTSHD